MRHARLYGSALSAILVLTAAGCDDDGSGDDGNGSETDAAIDGGENGRDAGTDARADTGGGGGDDGGQADGGPTACPPFSERAQVLVSDEIDQDATWTCDNYYVLTDKIFVVNDATVTVEAGTEVLGDNGGALIITREGRLVTEGTKEEPVVFTSSRNVGERLGGDWAGVVLLGSAPINVAGGTNHIEGLDPSDPRSEYGGDDADHDCGHLRYTRIEFAGEEISTGNELNGLTLGACGSDTLVEYVQVHKGLDDGIEAFGGTPKIRNVVLSSNDDESFDWDFGFSGTVQFLVALQHPNSDNGIEADNHPSEYDRSPRATPTLYNVTFIGATKTGWVARHGTWGTIRNAIFMNFDQAAVDVRDSESAAGAEMSPPELLVENSIFFNNGAGGTTHFPAETGASDNDDGFDEDAFFRAAARNNKFDEDPELGDADSLTDPDFVPASSSPAADGAATPPSGFDTSATYIGAFEPGGEDWTEGWTAYPED